MTRYIPATLAALALLAIPSAASAFGFNYSPQWTFTSSGGIPSCSGPGCGGNCCCGPCCSGDCPAPCGCGPCRLYPWYQYFPYEAHFQAPAPTKFPFWPPPMTANAFPAPYPPPGPYPYPPPAPLPPPLAKTPLAPAPAPVQPIGYYPQAPSYWYQR